MLELQDDIRLCNDTKMDQVEINDIISGPEVYQQEEEEDEEEEEEEFLSKITLFKLIFLLYLNLYEKEKGGPMSCKELFEHTHQRKNIGDFVSQKVEEAMETYVEQMVDKHGGDSIQHLEFDDMAWLAATGQPKKGQDSHGCAIATTPPHSSTLPNDQVRKVIFDALNNWLTQTLVPTLQTMGVGLRSLASVASSGASHVPPICDPTIKANQVERAERDDDEAEDPRIQDD
ncbi:hypothetical protein Taro_002428 [Colocasia esculenta]|uniref:Uncharacterized protein n=1 Tax=Colocasia esculenta TaxID=4460 RepID=A0A843TIN7_COLES|nr:hypothetical protein [Colocasia esculenta]